MIYMYCLVAAAIKLPTNLMFCGRRELAMRLHPNYKIIHPQSECVGQAMHS